MIRVPMQMCSNLRERPKIKILNRHENEVTGVAVTTAVCAGFVRLSIPMGNQISTANLVMVGPILMIPTAEIP